MTPHQLYVLTGIFGTPLKSNCGNYAAAQVLKEDGLIRLDDKDCFVVTAKGAAHVRQLCLLPQPVEAWVDHNGKLL